MPARYRILVELIRRMRDGEYPVGSQFPTTIALSVEFDVGRTTTIDAVISLLHDRGYLKGQPGVGRFVAERESWRS